MNCTSEDKYTQKDGICCDRCAAGQYMLNECDNTHTTNCTKCVPGRYTATKNHLPKCHVCKDCSSINNQRKVKDCTAQENTVCRCMPGFYCSNDDCDHCWPLTNCNLGEGVKVQATFTNDAICAPCPGGSYSDVKDFHSTCQTHKRCEDLGRVLKTPGTSTTDSICGNFKSHCSWILPTGLWSGLLLTALILFGLICWRAKRKSYKAEKNETRTFLQHPFKSTETDSSVAVSLVGLVPAAPATRLETPLPITDTELNGHCQDSCAVNGCKLPLFIPDESVVTCDTQEHEDGSLSITPLKASEYCTGNFLRTYSEPQEDEWCGT